MKNLFVAFCFWLLGMILTLGTLNLFLPTAPDPIVQHKLETFLKNKDDYTTLIVGSSFSYHNVIPTLLDENLRSRGIESRSYNLALPAGVYLEVEYLLEQVLLAKPKKLNLILLDVNPGFTARDRKDGWSRRDIYWHNLSATLRSIQHWSHEKPILSSEFFARAAKHSQAFVLHSLLWGRLSDALLNKDSLYINSKIDKLTAHHGFFSINWEVGDSFDRKRENWLIATESHQKLQKYDPPAVDTHNKIEYTSFASPLLQESGATLFVHRQPSMNDGALLYCQPPLCHDLGIDDRKKYPALFDPAMFFDFGHYNSEGAEHFTRALAEKIAAASGELK